MKQVLILMLFLFGIVVSFAKSYDQMSSDVVITGVGLDRNMLLYKVNEKPVLAPFLLNLFIGFGIGSFVQGDVTGGLLVLGSELLGVGLISSGFYSSHSSYTSYLGISLVSLGVITLFATRIAELIMPFTYALNYNQKLKEKLAISLGGLKPQFDINFNENDALSFELALTKKY
ncbi:P13 family porin (plasmid) [Borrelia coriaceae]|uniref:Uncharacterized protein n=1 Tax=Borrelia coriaceae ATCC 43381 TaxID=1408429 RepID=W5T2Q4_9SPIR|nr:P13 family porin [Borrelia coriaceae]AHH11606.1 Hypothetical protein BCO_0111401 [Borrelia coriaceae ATCC 43381]UPA17250.1 P13 family porin [Borrelia coriaceae]